MQTKGILAQTAMAGVQTLKENLQQQRNDYDIFFEQICEKATVLGMVKEPVIPCSHKVPHHLQHGDAEQRHFESEKSMFCTQYFEAIDACLSELNRRFDEESYALLRQIEIAFLNAANQEPIEFSNTLRKVYSNKIDFDQVIAELKLLHSLMKQCLPDVKRATSLDDFCGKLWSKSINLGKCCAFDSNISFGPNKCSVC